MDFITIIRYAWLAYDSSRPIARISDISAMVSTNHVYKVRLADGNNIIAKLSYFGRYEHFVEDHEIINVLSNNLPVRFENFLARALMKGNQLFFHRFQNDQIDAWVVFFRPIRIKNRMPDRLSEKNIEQLATEFANFHQSCQLIRHTLPNTSKTMTSDINLLLSTVDEAFPAHATLIRRQCDLFLDNTHQINAHGFDKIPVFVDWNIGNFSVTATGKFFSRWDYDWFRMSSRIVDFYFISRVVSDVGDRTSFTYNVGTLMEDRFLLFLKKYHAIFPLTRSEVLFIKEAYRFFLLNYVVRAGRNFFQASFARQLQHEAFTVHFQAIDQLFDADKLLRALEL
ncbi:MAG: hypothetical protein DA408_10450 [Bacteroidetes bacterium]|nr:MAG: hypothetical protein C7N36_09165 [Bacteroidota bacterium]PTM12476.1 MAG: hypothetical protein DA408_10450 [Bacteroidota bacterium]